MPSTTTTLPTHVIILEIYTFLPISQASSSLQLLSKGIRAAYGHYLVNGSFFGEREMREYREMAWFPLPKRERGIGREVAERSQHAEQELLSVQVDAFTLERRLDKMEDIALRCRLSPESPSRASAMHHLWPLIFEIYPNLGFPNLFHDLFHIYMNKGFNQDGFTRGSENFEVALYAELWKDLPWVKDDTLFPGFLDICWSCLTLVDTFARSGPPHVYFYKDSRIVTMQMVHSHAISAYRNAPDWIRNNREIAFKALDASVFATSSVGENLRSDRDYMMYASKKHGEIFEHASDSLKEDRDFVLELVSHKSCALKFASDALKDDKIVAMAAVKNFGDSLRHVSDRLKADKELVLEAVRRTGWSVEHCIGSLRMDREIALESVRQCPFSFRLLPEMFRSDKAILMEALKDRGVALAHAHPTLQLDREVLLVAAKHKQNYRQILDSNLPAWMKMFELQKELDEEEKKKKKKKRRR